MGRPAFRGLLALGLLGGLSAAAAPAASPVWAIHGAHSTLYLAGSVHLLPAQGAAPFGRSVGAAIKAAAAAPNR